MPEKGVVPDLGGVVEDSNILTIRLLDDRLQRQVFVFGGFWFFFFFVCVCVCVCDG